MMSDSESVAEYASTKQDKQDAIAVIDNLYNLYENDEYMKRRLTNFFKNRITTMFEDVYQMHIQRQSYVMEMFSDFSAWAITILDNILLLAHDEEGACNKLEMFLERCASRNVILKM